MSEQILCDLDEDVLIVKINRPEKKNALTLDMYSALVAAIEQAEEEHGPRVLVITGCGDMFTAGNDLGSFLSEVDLVDNHPVVRFLLKLATTDVPIVAAVNGLAVGIGTTLLLHCDQVVAASNAKFSLPFVNLGLVPEAGSSLLLPQLCGYQKAAELLMLGESFDARMALDIGLVGKVTDVDESLGEALIIAKKLSAKPRSALRKTKQLLRSNRKLLIECIENECREFSQFLQSPAAIEIMTAFMERREPDRSKFD
jgi:enoyl-CoA hydratase/carnithine racemase